MKVQRQCQNKAPFREFDQRQFGKNKRAIKCGRALKRKAQREKMQRQEKRKREAGKPVADS